MASSGICRSETIPQPARIAASSSTSRRFWTDQRIMAAINGRQSVSLQSLPGFVRADARARSKCESGLMAAIGMTSCARDPHGSHRSHGADCSRRALLRITITTLHALEIGPQAALRIDQELPGDHDLLSFLKARDDLDDFTALQPRHAPQPAESVRHPAPR